MKKKKTFTDRFIVYAASILGVVGIFDSINALPSFFGNADYYSLSVLILLISIIYLLLRFNDWI